MKEKNVKGRRIQRIVLAVIIVLLVGAYFGIDSFKSSINSSIAVLSQLNLNKVIEFIRSYGKYAAAFSFFLMILQSVAAPIPAFLITFSNAAIFGWLPGAVLSWTSSMVGAALCFYIANIFGRDVTEKFTSKGALESVDVFFERYGKYAILICRLLPFVSFDIVSYAAGLTSMSFASFIIATGLGQLPATIIYSYVGGMLTGGAQKVVMGLLILFAFSILVFMIKKIFNDKKKKAQE